MGVRSWWRELLHLHILYHKSDQGLRASFSSLTAAHLFSNVAGQEAERGNPKAENGELYQRRTEVVARTVSAKPDYGQTDPHQDGEYLGATRDCQHVGKPSGIFCLAPPSAPQSAWPTFLD